MEKVNVAGIGIAYIRRGRGTPLVLLHGYPLDHTIWDDVAPLLEEGFDLIIPDLRGFGQSDVMEADDSIIDFASDIAAPRRPHHPDRPGKDRRRRAHARMPGPLSPAGRIGSHHPALARTLACPSLAAPDARGPHLPPRRPLAAPAGQAGTLYRGR